MAWTKTQTFYDYSEYQKYLSETSSSQTIITALDTEKIHSDIYAAISTVTNKYYGREVFEKFLGTFGFETSLVTDFDFIRSSSYYSSIKTHIISNYDGETDGDIVRVKINL